MSWRSMRSGPDPALLLLPVVGMVLLGVVWPPFERFMDAAVGALCGLVVLVTALYIAWAFWGPRPSRGIEREDSRARAGHG